MARITRRSFFSSGSVCLLRQHLSLPHKLRHLPRISATFTALSLFVSQKLSLLCHIKMFVSHPARVSQHLGGHTMWGVHEDDDPTPSSSLRMLPKFEDFGKQRSEYASGVGGGGEGGHTWQRNILFFSFQILKPTQSCSTRIFHVFLQILKVSNILPQT